MNTHEPATDNASSLNRDLDSYFSGAALYGDDFSPAQIAEWFAREKEGYANLGAKNKTGYRYSYHALNRRHGFRRLSGRRFRSALGVGSAYGDEFLPMADKLDTLTILEASESLSASDNAAGLPCNYVMPQESGDLPFDDEAFDLITLFGVLHHIPNVSHVVRECSRVLAPGGAMLLREPIVSMGDWTRPRPGLTRSERGIPLEILHRIVKETGLLIRHDALCMFPPASIVAKKLGIEPFASCWFAGLDALLSRLFRWNLRYHATTVWQRFRPTSVFLVLEKPVHVKDIPRVGRNGG